ncbi:MAG: adenylate kinase [Actinomycetota bacterium]|nr:adenylate kinase [Actinomycetota bacterium]
MPAVRISIRGTSGSGKSTVGRAAAERLGIPFVELDAIRHQADWVELPDEEFVNRVRQVVAGNAWVVDGNYGAVRQVTGERATCIVWLDLPRWLVMAQVVRRSFARAAFRQELWNGNRETFRNWLEPEHPIRWAWTTHARRQRDYATESAGDDRWVRLTSRRAVRAWLERLVPPDVHPGRMASPDE